MPENKPPIEISKPKLLLVEGDDDLQFFICLLTHLRLDAIQVLSLGGIGNLKSSLNAIKETTKKLDSFDSIGIVRDADASFAKAFKMVAYALEDSNLPIPPKAMKKTTAKPHIQVMILPNNKFTGGLENVFMQAIDAASHTCIDGYISCMKKARQFKSKSAAKSIIYAFIAAQENPRLTLGASAHEGYWDFDNPAFSQIVKFIKSL